jgi:predicted nucleic acid-binding protein
LAAQIISELPSLKLNLVDIDTALAQKAAEIAADLSLRGMDAIYVAVAQRNSCTLITLDDEPYQRASQIISVLTPLEALNLLTNPAARD